MKKTLIAGFLTLTLLTGCVSSAVTGAVERNAARSDRYVELMDQGKTTPKQDQDFIRADRVANHALNYHLNDVPLPPDVAAIVSAEEGQ